MMRIFNSDNGTHSSGPGSLDTLTQICIPMIRLIKQGKQIPISGYTMLNELYQEMIKRKQIEKIGWITPFDKKRIWELAKKTGETDKEKLIQIARSIYLSEKI